MTFSRAFVTSGSLTDLVVDYCVSNGGLADLVVDYCVSNGGYDDVLREAMEEFRRFPNSARVHNCLQIVKTRLQDIARADLLRLYGPGFVPVCSSQWADTLNLVNGLLLFVDHIHSSTMSDIRAVYADSKERVVFSMVSRLISLYSSIMVLLRGGLVEQAVSPFNDVIKLLVIFHVLIDASSSAVDKYRESMNGARRRLFFQFQEGYRAAYHGNTNFLRALHFDARMNSELYDWADEYVGMAHPGFVNLLTRVSKDHPYLLQIYFRNSVSRSYVAIRNNIFPTDYYTESDWLYYFLLEDLARTLIQIVSAWSFWIAPGTEAILANAVLEYWFTDICDCMKAASVIDQVNLC